MKSSLLKIEFLCFVVWSFSVFPLSLHGQKKIYVKDFGVKSSTTVDATAGVIKALEACRSSAKTELIFEKGVYHFYADFGVDRYCFVSNNDEGLKRVIFPIEGIKNLTIDGKGSLFVFHGHVNPFVVANSANITFKDFSVDCARPFHSEGIILASNPDEMDLEISEQFPYEIRNNILVFTDFKKPMDDLRATVYKELLYDTHLLLEFDTEKRETAFMVRDYYTYTPLVAKSLGDRKVRIYHKGLKGTVGNTLVFGPSYRNHPSFTVSNSKDIRFENLNIHHAGGMGIIGQRVHNVAVLFCDFTPPEGRMISSTADATHFVNCTGKIELAHCNFRNHLDDATNIHGIYVQIFKKLAPDEVVVRLKHLHQLGFDFLKKGTNVEFVKGKSLITEGVGGVIEAERINKDLTRIKLSAPLPESIVEGDVIAEVLDYPEVHIHHNYIGKNRARGMLLNCKGKTVVEHNTFHAPGSAIMFQGNAYSWFEQGGVTDCTIRHNVFDNCKYGVWGSAVIAVASGVLEDKEISRYNKNIRIYNNTFRIFDDVFLLHTTSVDGLKWHNNKIERTNKYPSKHTETSYFSIEHCDNMEIMQP